MLFRRNNLVPTDSYFRSFLKRIGRPDIDGEISYEHPFTYWTMEIYRKDIKGGGGLGMLASDTLEIVKKLKMPSVFISLFYTKESKQKLDEKFNQEMESCSLTPPERGFRKIGIVAINTLINGVFKTNYS